MTLYEQLKSAMQAALVKVLPADFGVADPLLKETTDARFGDYQSNAAMGIAKTLKKPPRELAQQVVDVLEWREMCAKVEIAGPGFINLHLKPEFLAEHLTRLIDDERLGVTEADHPLQHVVDFSSPNLAKEMHIGHLRTTVTGEAICRLLEFSGHAVERINHVGDWGTQFGMLLEQVFETRPDVLENPDGFHVGDLEEFYKQAKARFDAEPEFAERSRQRVVELQGGEVTALKLWRAFLAESSRHCREIYALLDVRLQDMGESFYNDRLPGVVRDLLDGDFAEIDHGAVCLFLPGFTGRDGERLPFIVKKADGGYNYATTDLAAMRYRVGELKADRIIIITDIRQAQHFAMLFNAARLTGWAPEHVQLDHIGYGMILSADKRPYRTRDGGTVKLKDVIEEAVLRARNVISANARGSRSYAESEIECISKAVGLAAIKYFDLRHNLAGDYVFNWDTMLAMEGNTGPYMLYAHARICSIGRKAGVDLDGLRSADHPIKLHHQAEIGLSKMLAKFPDVIVEATLTLSPNVITEYLFRLSKTFNAFYDAKTGVRVIDAQTPSARASRLALCALTARALKTGLGLIGIRTVDAM